MIDAEPGGERGEILVDGGCRDPAARAGVIRAVDGQGWKLASGVSAPLTLSLRDDCAKLKLSLPTSADNLDVGEEPFYTVYVVPDFDSTADVTPITLRPSSGGTITLDGLTPGDYHVYTFAAHVELEYRNREALASLPNPGQTVTVSPGSTANLVVEVPKP